MGQTDPNHKNNFFLYYYAECIPYRFFLTKIMHITV